MTATLAHRRELCFWGWGYTDEALSRVEEDHLARLAAGLGAASIPGPAPAQWVKSPGFRYMQV